MDKKEIVKSINRRIEHLEKNIKDYERRILIVNPDFSALMAFKIIEYKAQVRELKDLLKEVDF